MDPQRWQKAKQVFYSVLEHTKEERTGYLSEVCARDPELRCEVEVLLQSHERAEQENFIEAPLYPIISPQTGKPSEGGDQSAGQLGPYRIVREIARGGMGSVYLAARSDDAYQKQVAIKLVGHEQGGEELCRRLVQEREILAGLDHPNIARLIDGGTTASGFPYIVMEYVEGEPIDTYCDRRQLSTRERLRLFRAICAPVQYAHQHLVIHRDIKPANILITAEGTPKLLDFGIAKLLQPVEESEAAHTVTRLGVMTPTYASPEQIKGERVTTASDVYSLGVLLYELLTGRRPYRTTSRRPDEIARAVCEEEPEKPSTAINRPIPTSSNDLEPGGVERVSRARASEPQKLRRMLEGDLDKIVLTALRKEPQRRYASVEQFAEDVRHYLEGLPVKARKNSVGYRAAKFTRRNKVPVAAAALLLLALFAGLAATLWQARVARAERDRARVERAKAERINQFLQGLFKAADPGMKGGDARIVDVLNDAGNRIDSELAGQPEVLAQAHEVIGNTYMTLYLFDGAEPHLRAALELNERMHGQNDPETLRIMAGLGLDLYGRVQFAESEQVLRRALDGLWKAGPASGEALGGALWTLGDMLRVEGNYQQAQPLLQESKEVFVRYDGPTHEYVAASVHSLGLLQDAEGHIDEAEALYRQTLDILYQLPERRRITLGDPLSSLTELGTILTLKNRYDEAEADLNEAVDYYRRIAGPNHPTLARPLKALAYLHLLKGDFAQADKEIKGALEAERVLPPGNLDSSYTLCVLGLIRTREGKLTEGEAYLRQALEMRSAGLRKGNIARITEAGLGECLTKQKRYREAEPLLTEAYNALKTNLGASHPVTIGARQLLIQLYQAWRKPELAAAVG